MEDFRFDPADLAPGDGKSASLDVSQFELRRVNSIGDPRFAQAYATLWQQFGAAQELESAEVLGRRLAWPPGAGPDGLAMRYELVLALREGAIVAVRDHTAAADDKGAVVHLSHVWIDPAWRRTGLAGWLRALPIQTARACLREAGLAPGLPIALVAEMEYPDGFDLSRDIRLKAYERAGFRKVDPKAIGYRQPDFRPPAVIDASGGPAPLPFQLILRRVGREEELQVFASEVRRVVERLYAFYGREFRPQDMAGLWRRLQSFPPAGASIALLPPTT